MEPLKEKIFRQELREISTRLKNENEALLKLIHEINAIGETSTLSSEKNKSKK